MARNDKIFYENAGAGVYDGVYGTGIGGWSNTNYRQITLEKPVTGELKTWLEANAVKMPLTGTWVFNSKPTSSSNWGVNINFTCNGTAYTNLSWSSSVGLIFNGTVVYDLDTTSWGTPLIAQ